MEEDDYHLKWARHHDAFRKVFLKLYENETLVDCTLAAEEKHIKAHRIVLMACSPYLEELLREHSNDYPIVFLDMQHDHLKAIVNYCYNGEVTVSHGDLEGFIKAAAMLRIKGLTNDDLYANGTSSDNFVNSESEVVNEENSEINGFAAGEDEKHPGGKTGGQGSDDTDLESDGSSIEADELEKMDVNDYLQTGGSILFPWTCTRCGEAFSTRTQHDQHRKTCILHRDLPWKCNQCPNTYKNKKDLVRHLNYCGKETPRLKCNMCGSTYKYVRGLRRHMKYCGKEVEPLHCPDCGKEFKYSRGLRRHQRSCGIVEALAKLAEKGVTPVLIRKNRMKEEPASLSGTESQDDTKTKNGKENEEIRANEKASNKSSTPKQPKTPISDAELTPSTEPSVCPECGKVYKYKRSYLRHIDSCISSTGADGEVTTDNAESSNKSQNDKIDNHDVIMDVDNADV